MLEDHAGNFGGSPVNESATPSGVFVVIKRETGIAQATLRIVELAPPGSQVQAEIAMLPEAHCDPTEAARGGPKHGVVYMVTKAGYLITVTVTNASMLVRTRVSQQSVSIPVGNEL